MILLAWPTTFSSSLFLFRKWVNFDEHKGGTSTNVDPRSEPSMPYYERPYSRLISSSDLLKTKHPPATASTNRSSSQQASMFNRKGSSVGSSKSKKDFKNKYGYIPDNYSSLEQVTQALRNSGLESSNLILGIDFTKSNEWTGKESFNNRSLHAIGDQPNPYEKAISIIGATLAPFDDDNLIPCFGFGDATTHDQEVFSFHDDGSPCHGFEEVLNCYKRVVADVQLAGPTSFAPVVEAAISIVEKSGGQFHILVIIADGQVTRGMDTSDGELSSQEQKTISSIVEASSYPLVIILVGVGDGPWADMKRFDDKLPAREFDNFQFVNFTGIMSTELSPTRKESAFALAALMEIPIQYVGVHELGLHGQTTGNAKRINPRPPPRPRGRAHVPHVNSTSATQDDDNKTCPICLTNEKDMAFGCGHMACRECGSRLSRCHICRQVISNRIRLYTG